MVDSDDEYDRKRRDKFRGERSSGESYRSDHRGDDRRREEWSDRNPFRSGRPRPDYRDCRVPREKFSPSRDHPTTKRMRSDWGEDIRPNSRYSGYDHFLLHNWGHEHYAGHGMHGYHIPSNTHPREVSTTVNEFHTQPSMLTLKQFLDTQDDSISDLDVLNKYSEYKLDFKRQELNDFFVTHKEEEWFKNKYHPIESARRKQEQRSFLKRRADVFKDLLFNGTVSSVTIDSSQADELLRLLDTVVIKLEGGTDEDLKILDKSLPEIKYPDTNFDSKIKETKAKDIKLKTQMNISPQRFSPNRDMSINDDEENWDEDEAQESRINESKTKNDNAMNRSRSQLAGSSISNSVDDCVAIDYNKPDRSKTEKEEDRAKENNSYEEQSIEIKLKLKMFNDLNKPKTVSPDRTEKTEFVDKDKNEVDKAKQEERIVTKICETFEKKKVDCSEAVDLEQYKNTTPLQTLHRTSSIFLRNLAPTITKAEIEALCQRFAGFLRVAIADPLAERRWFRRGWVTFKRDVNIKEICWNLNNTRLKDCEIGAIVNRDLSRRVRPINGMVAHKTVVRSDIELCAKIVVNLDGKYNLWEEQDKNDDISNGKDSYGFNSKNPVLHNIAEYLIEEGSAEEDELLGISVEHKDFSEGETIEIDPKIISVLDKIILYLRIVHSVDFYNHCEYPYEDEMPNRCGIIHVRGPIPQNKILTNEIQEYIRNFEKKMQTFLKKPLQFDEEELKKLGLKDATKEIEKFVQANTQELAKEKWLCPLSGKKFKGPEFIRKHIFNKHHDKVDEIRKEVEYFNNYLKDPKRPQIPEHSWNMRRTNPEASGPAGFRQGVYTATSLAPSYNMYASPMIMAPRGVGRGFAGGRRELPLEHQRQVIGYHDLDAPTNFDVFD